MSRRLERLSVLIQREISHVIMYEMNDPRLGFVTITAIKLAEDQANATVFMSVLGDEKVQQTTLETIEHARGHIQKLIGDRIKMRRVPILAFKLDEGVKRSVRVSALLRKLEEERGAPSEAGEEETPKAEDKEE
jgi:ribosome-binding factor A